MNIPLFLIACLFASDGAPSPSQYNVGAACFYQIISTPGKGKTSNDDDGWTLTWVWYPTRESSNVEELYKSFQDAKVKTKYPKPAPGSFPLIVFSHGLTATADQSTFLTDVLVRNGYIVVSIDHWGTSGHTFRPDRLFVGSLRRPPEISALLTKFIEASEGKDIPLFGRIDKDRIGAIGHSLGGMTVMALAGGLVSAKDVPVMPPPNPLPDFYDFRDPRIKAVVAYAPKFNPTFRPESFQKVTTPILLFGATNDLVAGPAQQQSIFDGWNGPAHLAILQGGSHFNFFDEDKAIRAGPMVRALHVSTMNRQQADEIIQRMTLEFLDRHLKGIGIDRPLTLTDGPLVKTMSRGDNAITSVAGSNLSNRNCGDNANQRSNPCTPRRRIKR